MLLKLMHALLLVAAGTTATGQRNPVELFEIGGFVSHVCSSMARSGFELYLSDELAS